MEHTPRTKFPPKWPQSNPTCKSSCKSRPNSHPTGWWVTVALPRRQVRWMVVNLLWWAHTRSRIWCSIKIIQLVRSKCLSSTLVNSSSTLLRIRRRTPHQSTFIKHRLPVIIRGKLTPFRRTTMWLIRSHQLYEQILSPTRWRSSTPRQIVRTTKTPERR